jgi:hypothetical protein
MNHNGKKYYLLDGKEISAEDLAQLRKENLGKEEKIVYIECDFVDAEK